MSSLTIEEIKKTLSENGIELPTGRPKKEEYVKLYQEHITLNASLSAAYSSDDEGSQSSRKVTSTNGGGDSQEFNDVENLSDDDLYARLKQLGCVVGPVLQNTRKVYERKLLKLLQMGHTNGYNNDIDNSINVDPLEISDSEVEIGRPVMAKRKSMERTATSQPSTSKGRSVSREPVNTTQPPVRENSIPRRTSYIEKIPRGSTQRIIEPIDTFQDAATPFALRQRSLGNTSGDRYVGQWSPRTSGLSVKPVKTEKPAYNKKYIIFIALLIVLTGLASVVYLQWAATDPYKLIEDEVDKEVKEHVARKADFTAE